jgi:serine protease Do
VVVTNVDPASAAASAGLRKGDVIQEVNHQAVRSVPDFSAAMQRSGSRPALVLVKRRNQVTYLTLKANS